MMRTKSKLFWVFAALIVAASCTNDVEETTMQGTDPHNSKLITFSGGTDHVSVLVFKENNGEFFYTKTVSGNWSEEGRLSAPLEIGKYKFIYTKSAGVNSSFFPNPLSENNTNFTEFRIDALTDNSRGNGYVLPTDEIFLPEYTEANQIIPIDGSDTVRGKLTRAVSQATLLLKRGYKGENGSYVEQHFPAGSDATDIVEAIQFDIQGVGNQLYLTGGKGNMNTFYTTNQEDSVLTGGYVHYTGPFVIPSDSGEKAQINIRILPKSGSGYPEMKSTVYGPFEKNKRLEITVWFTEPFETITIEVELKDMEDSIDGDTGIWE